MPKTFLFKIFLNKKFNEIVALDLRLVPLHPHNGCKGIHWRGVTFEILDIYEVPPSHSNGFYILGNSFSFHSYFFLTVTFSLFGFNSFEHAMTIVGYLCLLFEIILCLMLIFFLRSMFLVIYKLNSRDRTVARQLNFNYRFVRVQTQNTSAV